jgi:REP element-mobilizing transposase RayT
VHVTLRVASAVGMLRRRRVYHAVRRALAATGRDDFRVVHLSIQRNHIHLIVEADDREALIRGMQGFQISAARRLNAAISDGEPRRGAVFLDRYHARVLSSPRQVRNAIASDHRSHRVAGSPAQLQQQECLVAPIQHFPSWKAVLRQMPAQSCDGEKYIFCGCTARQLDAPEARFVYGW